ncbi:HNH endonuclease [Actinoplanes sp. NPDC026623]|uniref:HNH endonuclease n=1 Tax=Actinoplanes sp. NPDC026623 TaxID=3155610 RepID=UPI003401FDE2
MAKRAPDSISIRLPDGRSLDATNETPGPAERGTLELVEVLRPRLFDVCPICGEPAATSAEHVPPQRLGGKVMTRTCTRCNNGFGSRVEADLVDWYEGALTTWFASETVQGKRRVGRLLLRWTEDGEYLLMPAGPSDEIFAEILAAGDVDMEYDTPEHKRWSIALLKCVYLALCIKFGVIEGEWADQVRADLLAARDARSQADVPPSKIAQRLHVLRSFGPEPIGSDPIITGIVHGPDGPLEGVLLAGRLFVSWWPVNDDQETAPVETGRRVTTMCVGAPMQSVVTAVTPEQRTPTS